MLHKNGRRYNMANYRAICHSYKLLSAVVACRLMVVLENRLPDTQAGFRTARGCRDNVCAIRWFIDMVLREGRQDVVIFIDYSAAFDTKSQLFLDSALAETGVSSKFSALSRPYSPQQQASCTLDSRTEALKCWSHLTLREACCRGISSRRTDAVVCSQYTFLVICVSVCLLRQN